MTQPRILFLDQYGQMGGGQTVLLSLVQAAVTTDAAVTVLAPGGGTLRQAIANRFGDAVTFQPCPEPQLTHGRKTLMDIAALLAYGWRFRNNLRLLRQQDIVYLNGPRHLPHMLAYSLLIRAQMFCHLHLDHGGIEKRLLRLAMRWPNPFQLVANSRYVMTALGASDARVMLLENALDNALSSFGFVDRFASAQRPWKVAVLGTIRPEKGQDIAIQVCASRPDIMLHIVGRDGDGVASWIQALKLSATSNIAFEGSTTDIPHALEKLGIQISLVPSRWNEPFGLVAIESMACSAITIVSGRGGLAEIAERTSALVAPDASTLAQALDGLCALPAEALRDIAQAQHDAALHHYHSDRFLLEAKALLTAALKRSPGLQPTKPGKA